MFAAAEGLYFTWPQNVILKNCRQTTNVHKRENQMPSSFPIFLKCKTVIRCKKELKTSGQRQVSIEGLTFLTRCLSHMVQIEHLLFVSELSCFLCCFMICFSWVHGSHSKLHQTTRQITHSESIIKVLTLSPFTSFFDACFAWITTVTCILLIDQKRNLQINEYCVG